jgi:diguanylate cyclase
MHNKLQAKLLRDSTLKNIDKHQLIAHPDNYRLWFEYATGSIDALSADIDKMVSQQQLINEKICQQLFIQHVASNDQRSVDDTRIAISSMLNVMVDHLKDWDISSSSFCDSLNSCIKRLDNNPDIDEVKNIVTTVTAEAIKIRDSSLNIKSTLHNLSDEISALRQDVDRLGGEALTDALTQTMNRRGFDAALKDATERAQTDNSQCALIVGDIDDFKLINDNFGHQVGDKILKYIAATLSKHIRGGDTLARYGGEEFVIILPYTSFVGAMQVAENLRAAISARQLTTGSNGKIIGRLTISIGVSCYQSSEALEDFFERADQLMYQAKRNGKDQVMGSEK